MCLLHCKDDRAKTCPISIPTTNLPRRKAKKPMSHVSPASYTFHNIYKRKGEFLGEGSCGKVETFVNSHTGRQCAVKTIEKSSASFSRSEVMKEIEVYHLCEGHPNIVELLEYFEEDDKFYLVFEKISGGSLLQHIQKRRRLSEAQASVVISNLAESLTLLHSQGIAHRDIKPANVLCTHLDSPCPVKLCDFDLCSAAHNGPRTPRLGTPVGSVDFMAPEVVDAFVLDEPICNYPELYYDKKCDLWSLGVLMYILLCGYPPFIGQCGADCGWHLGEPCQDCEEELFSSIREGKFSYPEREWSNISMEAKHLLESLLEKDVQSRLDAEDVLEHPWIVSRGGSHKLERKKNVRSVMDFSNSSGGFNSGGSGGFNGMEMEDWSFKKGAFASSNSSGEESFSTSSFELSPPTFFKMELNRNW